MEMHALISNYRNDWDEWYIPGVARSNDDVSLGMFLELNVGP